MTPNDNTSPNHVFPVNCDTLESMKTRIRTSSHNRCLRGGSLKGYTNCVILQGMLEAEKKARHKASRIS